MATITRKLHYQHFYKTEHSYRSICSCHWRYYVRIPTDTSSEAISTAITRVLNEQEDHFQWHLHKYLSKINNHELAV